MHGNISQGARPVLNKISIQNTYQENIIEAAIDPRFKESSALENQCGENIKLVCVDTKPLVGRGSRTEISLSVNFHACMVRFQRVEPEILPKVGWKYQLGEDAQRPRLKGWTCCIL
jgi:hypothetical protein